MKKLLILPLIIMIIVTGCSKEDKAKRAIKDYLSKNMHDFKSYESVGFGKLDTMMTVFEGSNEYIKSELIIDPLVDSVKIVGEARERIISQNENSHILYPSWYAGSKFDRDERSELKKLTAINWRLLDSAEKLIAIQKADKLKFKPEFDGYAMEHSYRGKNMNGVTILTTETFRISKNLDQVEFVTNFGKK